MSYLSKSLYMAGLTCPRLLWVTVHDKARLPPVDASTQARFDTGHEIGNLAKQRFPGGIEIGRDQATTATKQEMPKRKPLFEASFSANNCYCKVDVLVPVDEDEWDLIEVKSSTSVKPEHLEDVAFQRWVLESSGVHVRRAHVMYVNNEYVRKGPVDIEQLFAMDDVTEATGLLLDAVPDNAATLLAILDGPEPQTRLGIECVSPASCPVCLPQDASILDLYRFGAKAWPLLNEGIFHIEDLPPTVKLNEKQQIQKKAHLTQQPHVDVANLSAWFKKLEYPIQILDFETFNSAVPLFDGTRPYQQVPFQFSTHIIEEDGTVSHIEFLADSGDPRAALVRALHTLRPKGTVLAHSASFERNVLEDLAEVFPEDAHWIHEIISRLNDSIEPFRNFWYYHPKQCGSCSLKDILPALTGSGYEGMEIANGDVASQQYLLVTYGDKVDAAERERVRKALLTYCKKDTEAVVELLNALQKGCGDMKGGERP